MTEKLFESLSLPNGQQVKNRFFKSAMHEAMAKRDNEPTQEYVNLYETWARENIGILVTGNVMVDRKGLAEPGNVVVDEETDKIMLEKWARAGGKKATKLIMQLNHPGKQAPKTITKNPVAPSAIPLAGDLGAFFNPPRALTEQEVKGLVQKYIASAQVAYETGFAGVQLHAAHGYLINQFLSAADNQRTDQYGGSLENRMRFLLEIYEGIRRVTPADFIIGVKINSADFKDRGFTEADSLAVIEVLSDLGIDFVEISGGNYEKPKMFAESKGQVFFLDFAKKVADKVTAPIVLTGGISKLSSMKEILAETNIAMLGLARPLALDPQLVTKIKEGTYRDIQVPRLTTKIRKLDERLGSYLALNYYEMQMARIGRGQSPIISSNAWGPLFFGLRAHGLTALLPKRG